jgi:hypothetical protein
VLTLAIISILDEFEPLPIFPRKMSKRSSSKVDAEFAFWETLRRHGDRMSKKQPKMVQKNLLHTYQN